MSQIGLRYRAIGMIEGGMTQRQVAKSLKVGLRSIARWWKSHKSGQSLHDKPRSGRPEKIHHVAKQVISLSIGKRGQSTRKLARRLTSKGYSVSRETVRRHLKNEINLKAYRRPRKPRLTEKMKKARIEFAKSKLNWTLNDWKNVLWSDESSFQLFPPSNPNCDRVWLHSPSKVPPTFTVKHPPKVMVWGMFSYRALSQLHFVPQKQSVTSQYYREEILSKTAMEAMSRSRMNGSLVSRKILKCTSNAIFMQDSAPPHTAVANQVWLSEHFPLYWRKGEWPGNSPNLNPIENLWAIMKNRVAEMRPATTLDQLVRQLNLAWSSLDETILENLVASMPNRMKKVLQMKGDYIGN